MVPPGFPLEVPPELCIRDLFFGQQVAVLGRLEPNRAVLVGSLTYSASGGVMTMNMESNFIAALMRLVQEIAVPVKLVGSADNVPDLKSMLRRQADVMFLTPDADFTNIDFVTGWSENGGTVDIMEYDAHYGEWLFVRSGDECDDATTGCGYCGASFIGGEDEGSYCSSECRVYADGKVR